MTGVPRSTIGDIVTGQVCPTLATMEQLAAGLKTTILTCTSLNISDFQKASGIPDNAQLFNFRHVLYSERKILLKTNVRKWLHHKYFCDNMKSRNFEQMFEKT